MKIKHAYFDKAEIRERLGVSEDEQLYYYKHRIRLLAKASENGKIYSKTENAKVKHKRSYEHNLATCPEKLRARALLKAAVRDGRVKKMPCEVCGDPKTEGHHDDYSKPLEARWLCRLHHMILEGRWIPRN